MKFVNLTAVNLQVERSQMEETITSAPATEIIDDLELPITALRGGVATPAPELFYPVSINIDFIRNYYPRKGDRPGTRIVYPNGAAEIVKESYAEVKAAISSLNN